MTVISIKTPPNTSVNQVYETSHQFPLPSGMIPVDVMHKIDDKVPQELNIPIVNTNNNIASITKNTVLVSLRPAEEANDIFSLDWGHIAPKQAVGSGGSSDSTRDVRTGA